MSAFLSRHAAVVGDDVVNQLQQLSRPLRGKSVVHINSTSAGGGVAEILSQLVPFQRELGIDARWEVLSGDDAFYNCTKRFHNALQGMPVDVAPRLLKGYEENNLANAERLAPLLRDADFVFVHDPQPAALITHTPTRTGKW
ncbi:MAG: glycosyl transferase family 1, partial [Acidobacteriota bacterium]|nr:glycosyl transferase family 1 [Acidobacteriota bacterium]